MKTKKIMLIIGIAAALVIFLTVASYADTPDVSGAIENTWNATKNQIKAVVNNVVFPVLDVILAIAFFVKLSSAYFDYRKHGQFEWVAPVLLFCTLLFSLSAPTFLWSMLGM